MKPFQIPRWRKQLIDKKFQRQARVTSQAVTAMEAVMKRAVAYILEHALATERFAEPTLNDMFAVTDDFYRAVVEQAFYACEEEKQEAKGRKRLSAPPKGIPRRVDSLEKLFRDKRQWDKIMKRSKVLTDRLRKSYLKKLRERFEEIGPKLQSGEISPDQAKLELMEKWHASKSRVETIFRTETTNYFASTQVAFFSGDDEIIGFLFDSVKDMARTDICRSRHGLIYRPDTKELRKNTPALHWNCRSHLIPLANIPHNRKMLDDPERDPKNRTVAPLPPGWRR